MYAILAIVFMYASMHKTSMLVNKQNLVLYWIKVLGKMTNEITKNQRRAGREH